MKKFIARIAPAYYSVLILICLCLLVGDKTPGATDAAFWSLKAVAVIILLFSAWRLNKYCK